MSANLIFTIPTYNEVDNIKQLLAKIRAMYPESLVLVIDDNSPDGTFKIVQQEEKKFPKNIKLILRNGKRGRGLAGKEGFIKALELKADYIVEMDADFSHNPKYIPELLAPLESGEADIVLGSRKVKQKQGDRRGCLRSLITNLAGVYIRTMLRTNIMDVTSGFRAYTRDALKQIKPKNLKATSPDIVEEVLYKAIQARLRIIEVPIVFEDRKHGKSTFNAQIMYRVLLSVFKLRVKGRL